MYCFRFIISSVYRKEVECQLKMDQRLGNLRQVKYLLAILRVVQGFQVVAVEEKLEVRLIRVHVVLHLHMGVAEAPLCN